MQYKNIEISFKHRSVTHSLLVLIPSSYLEIDAELKGINQENFRLPTLGPQLCKYRDEVHFGKGFFVLRGLDPKKYSGEENNVIFLGISKYIGETSGRQDQTGNMIGTCSFP